MTNTQPQPSSSVGFFFCNHYMQGIHGGIQSLHAGIELCLNFPPGTPGFDVLKEWGRSSSPNVVLLNAGYQSRLENIALTIEAFNEANKGGVILPYARFREGQDEMNGTLTAVGVIIPGDWVSREFTVSPDAVASAAEEGDPTEVARTLVDWPMADRLLFMRRGMGLRT